MPPAASAATSDSAAGPPPSATTCQTTATAHSPAASSESAIDATSRRYWLCRRGASALGRLVMGSSGGRRPWSVTGTTGRTRFRGRRTGRVPVSAPGASVRDMLDHLALQCADVDAAAAFYLAGLRALRRARGDALRHTRRAPSSGCAARTACPQLWFGADGGRRATGRCTWRSPRRPGRPSTRCSPRRRRRGRRSCTSRAIWPEYHPGYYGVFFRDPDGNNVEAVHHTFAA